MKKRKLILLFLTFYFYFLQSLSNNHNMSTTTAAVLPTVQLQVNYNEVKTIAKDFITKFKDSMIDIDDEINQSHEGKYMNILQQVANRQKTSINIEFDDLKLFLTNYDPDSSNTYQEARRLLPTMLTNTRHFVELFSQGLMTLCQNQQKK